MNDTTTKHIAEVPFISTRDLMQFTKHTHSKIRKTVRGLSDKGLIGEFEIGEFIHWQNKKNYTEYFVSPLDIDLILYELRPKHPKQQFKKKPIPKSVRKKVYNRDPHECRHCGSTYKLGLDHIVPESRGGSNKAENLQILCGPCNSSKGTKLMHEWLEVM